MNIPGNLIALIHLRLIRLDIVVARHRITEMVSIYSVVTEIYELTSNYIHWNKTVTCLSSNRV